MLLVTSSLTSSSTRSAIRTGAQSMMSRVLRRPRPGADAVGASRKVASRTGGTACGESHWGVLRSGILWVYPAPDETPLAPGSATQLEWDPCLRGRDTTPREPTAPGAC